MIAYLRINSVLRVLDERIYKPIADAERGKLDMYVLRCAIRDRLFWPTTVSYEPRRFGL
jgi:hypothetical protein